MNSRTKKVNTATFFIHSSLVPVAPSVVAGIAKYKGIENARALDASYEKEQIKNDFSLVSGTVNTLCIIESALPSLSVFWQTWSTLTFRQKTAVSFCMFVGVGSAAYSLSQMGIEQHTMTAGGAATLSCSLFRASQLLAVKYYTDNIKEKKDSNALVPLLSDACDHHVTKSFGGRGG